MTDVVLGTGPLGLAVMQELRKRGREVAIVNRSGQAAVPEGVKVLKGDLYRLSDAEWILQGAETVYHCAAPPYHLWPERFPPLQESILMAAAKAEAKLVFADNLYMYGEVAGVQYEELPYKAITRKGQVRARLAEKTLEAHRRGDVRTAIVRGSDFYGPGVLNSTAGERMFRPVVSGKASSVMGNPELLHTYTYIGDFARALADVGKADDAFGQVWHAPNAETVTTRTFIERAYDAAGRKGPVRISRMNRFMLQLGGLFIPAAKESVEMLYQNEQPFVVDSSKFTRRFGFAGTPLRDALEDTVEWYRNLQGILTVSS